jgi:hypothetical protein
MRRCVPVACEELLERQAGVIERQQARAAGLRPDVIDGLVRSGRWQRMGWGVYAAFTGVPQRQAELWAVLLRAGPDAVLSHYTAAGLTGLMDLRTEQVHVVVPRDRQPRRISGVVLHRVDRARIVRHPVLLPPRTRIEETVLDLVDAAATADEAFGWVFRATGQRLTTPERLRQAKAGRQRMRWGTELIRCLDTTDDGVRSNLEHRYVWSVERPHRLPRPVRQARVVRNGRVCYLDNFYPEYLVCTELDGRAAHPVGERWRDFRRDNAGATDGVITLRYGWSDVSGQPCQVAAQIAAVLTQRGWPDRPRRCGATCTLCP